MDLSRLTRGSVIAALGGFILLIALFLLPWYKVDEAKLAPLQISKSLYAQTTTTQPPTTPTTPTTPGQTTTPTAPPTIPDQVTVNAPPADFGAWRGQGFLGTIANLVILAAALVALALAVLRAGGESHPIGEPGRVITGFGVAALVMVILRIFFPVEEIAGFEFDSGLNYGIFITLIGTLMLIAGGLLQQQEEAMTTRRRPPRVPSEPPPAPPSEPLAPESPAPEQPPSKPPPSPPSGPAA
jgi:hypothetical protein